MRFIQYFVSGFLLSFVTAMSPAAQIGVSYGTSCPVSFNDTVGQSCSGQSPNGAYQGYAFAQADLLTGLHAEASSTMIGATAPPFYPGGTASADADIVDTATLGGAPASGFLQFTFSVDGTLLLAADDPGSDVADEFMAVNSAAGFFNSAILSGNIGQVSTTQTVRTPYSGVVLNLDLILVTSADCGTGSPTDNCTALADFSSTSRILGVEVFDSAGTLIPNATLTSSSGFVYPSGSLVTPEPGSAALGLLSLAILAAVRGIRRKASARGVSTAA